MKHLLLLLALCVSTFLSGQDDQFEGAQNFTGTIYRSGNVGIGTSSSPNGKLHVYGDIIQSRNNGGFIFTQAYQQDQHFLSVVPNASGAYATDWQWNKGLRFDGLTGQLTKYVENSTAIALAVASDLGTTFKVYGDGRVVIGNVTAPVGYKLYVEKGILAEKVKVAISAGNEWKDSVFDSDHNLMQISDLKDYITKYKKLPGFKSGEEYYREGGLDLKEIIILQQEKIEELYLYIIQINQEIAKLKE